MKDGYLFIILSIIVLFFFACTRRKNDDMTHLVKEWEKKEIIFPNNLYFLKSASNLNGNLNCSKELEHYAS